MDLESVPQKGRESPCNGDGVSFKTSVSDGCGLRIIIRCYPILAVMELKLVISSLLSRSLWMDCVSWPLVGVVPPSHSLGYLIWTLWSCFLSVYSNLRSIPNIKKFYKGGSRENTVQ